MNERVAFIEKRSLCEAKRTALLRELEAIDAQLGIRVEDPVPQTSRPSMFTLASFLACAAAVIAIAHCAASP